MKLSTDYLENYPRPLPYDTWNISADTSSHALSSIPQPSSDRLGVEPEQNPSQSSNKHETAPIHDDKNMTEILEQGDPDALRLPTFWETTISHIHDEEAAELGTKMHNVGH